MFQDKKFRKRPIEEVFDDIDELYTMYPNAQSIFLIDGNVMVLGTKYLLKVITKIKETFPHMENIALYSELNDFRRKTVDELKQLKEAGLTMAYSGLESGDTQVLEKIQKGMTPQQAIEGMAKAKEAGIRVLLSFIFGLGGKDRSKEHIIETTKILNILQPEELAPMALAGQPGSTLEKELKNSEFILPSVTQIFEEEKYLLENLEDFEMFYWGNHGNNISPQKGFLPLSRKPFLSYLEDKFENSPLDKDNPLNTFSW
jgi:radical SAM superfamily enzyme YgiQ (UPF0313 family)